MAQFHLNSFFGGKSGSRNEFNKREAETSETVNRCSLDAAKHFQPKTFGENKICGQKKRKHS
jgi:hypothetical protein